MSFRTLSQWAYWFAFGALFGFATFGYAYRHIDGSLDTGMIYVWTIMALVGSILIALKNHRIGDRRLRALVSLADVAVLASALVLIAVLPSAIGNIAKGLVLVALFAAYLLWYFRSLDTFGAT